MKKIIGKIKNQSGVSLLETIVSISMFSMVVLSATAIFQLVVDGQRSAIAAQNIQENLRYIFEAISKETRNAKKNDGSCGIPTNNTYNLVGDNMLYFINKEGECVWYYVNNGTLVVQRGIYTASTTPPQVKVNSIKFVVDDNVFGSVVATVQPKVVINIDAEVNTTKSEHKQKMRMQTMISSRRY